MAIRTDRVAVRVEVDGAAAHHLWYSRKHHAFGGSLSVWTSDAGSTHELIAARELVLPALQERRQRAAGAGRQGVHRRWNRRA